MEFKFSHNSINVKDLDKSVEFYKAALGLDVVRVEGPESGEFVIKFLGDTQSSVHKLELTWLRDWDRPYNLGDNEMHLAFETDNFDGAYAKHKEMECICYENKEMGVYFISDPDGYWLEIIPTQQ